MIGATLAAMPTDETSPSPRDRPPRDPSVEGPSAGRGGDDGGRSWFGTLDQADFDIDFLERLLARRPDRADLLRLLGELASRKGLCARALEIDRRLVALLPDDSVARYNLACSLALAGRDDEALECLVAAFRLGYDDVAHMAVDPDLASLRGRPEFRVLLGRG